MRKVSEESQEKLEALKKQVGGILAEQNTDKITAFKGIIDSLQGEVIANYEAAAACNYDPERPTAQKDASIVERLNFVAKKAFENNLSAALPCFMGHKGTKDEFYLRGSDVVSQGKDGYRKLSPENHDARIALRQGELEEQNRQASFEQQKRKMELSFQKNKVR